MTIYLLNHRPPSHEPFKSIMRLPKDEAVAMAARLRADNDCKASERFGKEFADSYYDERLRAEEWMCESFVALGGKPQTKHPLYFYVHGWKYAEKFWPDGIVERIALDDIDPQDISFICGDSCGEANIPLPDRQPLFLKDRLFAMIAEKGGGKSGIEELLKHAKHRMIEAHLWNDKYVLYSEST